MSGGLTLTRRRSGRPPGSGAGEVVPDRGHLRPQSEDRLEGAPAFDAGIFVNSLHHVAEAHVPVGAFAAGVEPGRDDGRDERPQNGEQAAAEPAAEARPAPERKPLVAGPAGGVYIPPFKLAQMMAEAAVWIAPCRRQSLWGQSAAVIFTVPFLMVNSFCP